MTDSDLKTVKATRRQIDIMFALMRAAGPHWKAGGLCQVGSDRIGFSISRKDHVIVALLAAMQLGWPEDEVRDLIYKICEVR